jgi:predicted AAA+ superfamily ATPase
MALPSLISPVLLDQLFTGKIRLKLLARLLLNPSSQVYLRQLQRELNVSSNTVRLELNKLSEMKLISVVESEEGKIKKYVANTFHPMYSSLRGLVLKYIGVDQLLEEVFYKLGDLERVYLTGDMAEGKESPFIDLVVVGNIDRAYFDILVTSAERLLKKKIRAAVYDSEEFNNSIILCIPSICLCGSKEC